MKKITVILLFWLAGMGLTAQTNFQRNNLFDSDWKFFRGGNQGAEKVGLAKT